jgi:2'-5' RNA ligase
MRLFIALNIPKKQRSRIHRAARPLREADLPVRWSDPDNYHVTLKFLGQVRREKLQGIEEAITGVAGSTRGFDTSFAGFGAFPTIRRPRVIWLEWGLADAGYDPETRAFHPHVTLGRAEPGGGAGAFRGLDELVADMSFEGGLKVHTVDLMRSHLSRSGASYSIVSSVRLTGP